MSSNFGQLADIRVSSIQCHSKTILDKDCNLKVNDATIKNLMIKEDANFAGNVEIQGNLNVTAPLNIEGNLIINGQQVVGPRQIDVVDLSLDGTLSTLIGSNNGTVENTTFFPGSINQNFVELTIKINQITDVLRKHGLM